MDSDDDSSEYIYISRPQSKIDTVSEKYDTDIDTDGDSEDGPENDENDDNEYIIDIPNNTSHKAIKMIRAFIGYKRHFVKDGNIIAFFDKTRTFLIEFEKLKLEFPNSLYSKRCYKNKYDSSFFKGNKSDSVIDWRKKTIEI
jgi:hypothetical protein